MHRAYIVIIIKKLYFFSPKCIKINGNKINLNDKIIEKSGFYKNKKPFHIGDIDVNKILVSKKEPHRKHNSLIYFIGYNDNDVIRPLCLRLPQMTGYINKFENKKKY